MARKRHTPDEIAAKLRRWTCWSHKGGAALAVRATAAVSGAKRLPAPPAVGNQPAAPASAPALEATTKAEVSRQSETPK